MLRKTINILMSMMLLVSTTGFTVSKHYCGNELVTIAIDSQAKSCCNMDSNCCHTENKHFQVKEDFVTSVSIDNFQQNHFDLLFPICFHSIDCKPRVTLNSNLEFIDLPPPPKIQTTLSLLQTYLC